MDKKYLSIDEQIELLKSKNLKIVSIKNAKKKLESIGYYKLINAYKIPFVHKVDGNNKYYDNVTFEEIYNLYEFDRKLKTIVFEATTNVEINIKSYISEVISKNYGIKYKNYMLAENYKPDSISSSSFKDIKKQFSASIRKQYSNNNPSIVWYKNNYNNFPFWVISNVLTFGTISKFYGVMKTQDQIEVAKKYNLPYDYLESYLIHINMIRNICAHNSVLYRYKSKNSLPQKLSKVKNIYEKLGIDINKQTGRYKRGINDLLGTIIVFKLLLSKENYNLFKTRLFGLLSKLKKNIDSIVLKIIIEEMGFDYNFDFIKILDEII